MVTGIYKLDEGSPTLLPGCSNNPDLSLTVLMKILISLSLRELDPGKAFMTGKLTIRGNKSIALQLLGQYKLPKLLTLLIATFPTQNPLRIPSLRNPMVPFQVP